MTFEEIFFNTTIEILSDPVVYGEIRYCMENNIPFEFEIKEKR